MTNILNKNLLKSIKNKATIVSDKINNFRAKISLGFEIIFWTSI